MLISPIRLWFMLASAHLKTLRTFCLPASVPIAIPYLLYSSFCGLFCYGSNGIIISRLSRRI